MIDFEALIQQEMANLLNVAERRTVGHTEKFAADWRNRFGKQELIGDETGEPGTAEELKQYTLAMRRKRGNFDERMLIDPSHDHVATEGTIRDSIEVENDHKYEEAHSAEGKLAVAMTATTKHSKFPLNEYGWGQTEWGAPIPIRTTLLPSRNEVGTEFKGLVKGDIEAATGKKWTKRG